jgi:hypothetical protein
MELAARSSPLTLLVSRVGLTVNKKPALPPHHVAGRAQSPQGGSKLHYCPSLTVEVSCAFGENGYRHRVRGSMSILNKS